ncbi:hypothetical protein BJ508DRAFT_302706 [Ascobolus immersus RN42]|uniref:Uncharacterized protein n=1 Tax=Ascobolus immersus RN42 TaxID=1160509 RepID=A0A3N4IHV9_ASCIM|nr:hypothetical protein BJ508DRAFT_302706 [Ascobolus immersus RN42]
MVFNFFGIPTSLLTYARYTEALWARIRRAQTHGLPLGRAPTEEEWAVLDPSGPKDINQTNVDLRRQEHRKRTRLLKRAMKMKRVESADREWARNVQMLGVEGRAVESGERMEVEGTESMEEVEVPKVRDETAAIAKATRQEAYFGSEDEGGMRGFGGKDDELNWEGVIEAETRMQC